MPHLYLGRWEWQTVRYETEPGAPPLIRQLWAPPGAGAYGGLDLRPATAEVQGQVGGVGGFGLFSYPSARSHPLLLLDVGDDPERLLTGAQAIGIGNFFSLTLSERRLSRIIRELYPLRGSIAGGTGLTIPGFGSIVRERVEVGDPVWLQTVAVFRVNYRRQRPPTLASADSRLEPLKRWTGATMRQLGVADPALVLPSEYVADGFLPPRTTIGDTFVETSNTSLDAHTATGTGGGFSWTEVSGNWTVDATRDDAGTETNADATARAEGALSSDDHYSQNDVTNYADFKWAGAITRFAAAANTGYVYIRRNANGSSHTIEKIVAGVYTSLAATENDYPAPATPFLIKLTSDSADLHTAVQVSTTKVTVTDTSITGNVRAGMYAYHARVGLDQVNRDNFEAADLGVQAYTRSASVAVGAKAVATRVAAMYRQAPVATGAKATAARGAGMYRRASVLVGVSPAASRRLAGGRKASVAIGVLTAASRAAAVGRTVSVKVGVGASAVRVFSRTVKASVVVGMTMNASRVVDLTRKASAVIGAAATAARRTTFSRIASAVVGLAVAASRAFTPAAARGTATASDALAGSATITLALAGTAAGSDALIGTATGSNALAGTATGSDS